MIKIVPDDYAAYRRAHGKAGSFDQVRVWCEAQDKMIAETTIIPKRKIWVRRPGFVRFDQMPGYQPNKGE